MNNDILNSIKTILQKHLWSDDYKFFLYGSRARWDYNFRSDYDIWILWKSINENIKNAIKDDIDQNVPALVDVTDFSKVSEDFKKIAMKNIIWLD